MYGFIEAIVIAVIICFQLFIAYKLFFKIESYKAIYNFEDLPIISQKNVSKEVFKSGNVDEILMFDGDDGIINITYLNYQQKSRLLTTIVKYINVYLIKNKGAAIDFHLIKDIVDKHTETSQNEIENRIPAPLYLGLAATMLGIIIGLFSVNFDEGNDALNAIQPLINGVKWAMSASVIGLIITTIFSIKIYKDAQIEVDEEKSEFLSKLQSELMPKMATGKMPEVSILSNKLDVFARNTSSSISQLDTIVRNTSNTVEREQQLIKDIRRLDVTKITTANIEVFSQLDIMMDSFNNFANYYNQLNNSMNGTTELVNKLEQFIGTTENINAVLEGIKSNVEESNSATSFFNNHIKSFSRYSDAVNEAVVNSDSKMTKFINELGRLTEEQFNSFNEAIGNFDSKLSTAFAHSIEKFTEAMDAQIIRTEEAFENSRPKFEKLDKLDHLENIEKRLVNLEDKLASAINHSSKDIITVLKGMKNLGTEITEKPEGINTTLHPRKYSFETVLIGLKTGVYLIIISYATHSLLQYFDLMN